MRYDAMRGVERVRGQPRTLVEREDRDKGLRAKIDTAKAAARRATSKENYEGERRRRGFDVIVEEDEDEDEEEKEEEA